ncbi:glycosyltransferase family 4 protein [Lactobacillus helveticus]|uniref:glycosyltransferase family 4 protein n=1 Tax=Lactobacillus helveticus TaxID=1587 RepID=UPI00081AB039|nr:glycosyltransferase family 4 protein [Lactobacillus helveticus]ANZ56476.1 glycosyltransferase [Lactobacillus helveticus]AQY52919.1 glycosyltransferase [Lactobacillus helveticus]MBU6034674.1 glycosyltransferase family 4 protein [Lactobacillus helveticus]MBW1220215.1 glycosyltransferase family 4 protein [Lactobacillus helveticus]MDY0875694.1 glycosyltransferase family 4 protein [Lactobacillus helveticus]
MDRKIRVLHVAEAAGGVERYLETLFKYSKDKVENILVCSQNYDYKKFKTLADRVIVLKMAHDIEPSSDIKVERTLRRIIKQLKPDIVYAHSSKAGAFARIADLGLNNKVIYNPHGWAFNMQQSAKKKEMYKWVEKISAHFCDKIVCISDAEKESALREKICKPSKLQVIYNGIDLEEIEKTTPMSRDQLGIPDDAFVVGMVGRLSKQKAPDTFVKAAKLIKEKIPNAFFLMVGDGELRDQIEKLINQYNLSSSFLITGWVDNPTAYMKIMDVGMLLSRWEGFGLVLPEYMACGVPIVATNVDAIPNIVTNGVNGMLVDKDDYHKAADAVDKLFKQPDLRSSLVKTESNIVKNKFDGKRVAQNSEQLYKELI